MKYYFIVNMIGHKNHGKVKDIIEANNRDGAILLYKEKHNIPANTKLKTLKIINEHKYNYEYNNEELKKEVDKAIKELEYCKAKLRGEL